MTQRKKIVLIRVWRSPPIAASVEQLLINSFPEFQVDTIDITSLIKANWWILFTNTYHTFKEYGKQIFLRKKTFKYYFFGTTYLFRKVKSLLTSVLEKQNAELAFTFQLQSLFDASQTGIPHFVYTDHTVLASLTYPDIDPSALYSEEWIRLEREIYKNASIIFTRSHNISQSLNEQYSINLEKVICVYAGSNVKISTENLSNDNYSNRNILFVGIDWLRKGGPLLVEAFERILKNFPDAQLTIVGAEPQIDNPRVQIIGNIPIDQVHKQYERASIFCLPTLVEPFGVAFVEALSHSLPIIGTNIGAVPDFVIDGKNGFLIRPNDVDSLEKALSKLLNDPKKCQDFGTQGRLLAEARYNWHSVGKALRKNILPIIENHKNKP